MEIGARFERSEADYVDWVADFTEAIRSKCVIGERVLLPRGLWLSIPVKSRVVLLSWQRWSLPPHHMIGEETIEETFLQTNYFTRLRQVLGLSDAETGRPEGLLPTGIEENLWQIWNRWLI